MSDDETTFDAAIRLRDTKRYRESIAAFEALIADPVSPKRQVVHAHLQAGGLAKKLFAFDVAERHARRAVELAPNNELASLLLFHVMSSTAELLQALQEMVRFVSRRDSRMYRELLADEYDAVDLGSEYAALVDRARVELARRQTK